MRDDQDPFDDIDDTVFADTPAPGASGRAGALEAWWAEHSQREIEATVPKAIEYGSTDLQDIGRALLGPGYDDAACAEAGIAFYALGKVSRIIAAIREHRSPSADSWFDLGVYAKMAQRVKEVGSWPGV